nr:MAG TPA: hypothetical protein [Caudoviricetes sp.]
MIICIYTNLSISNYICYINWMLMIPIFFYTSW